MCVNFRQLLNSKRSRIGYTLKFKSENNTYSPLFFEGTYNLNMPYYSGCSIRLKQVDLYTKELVPAFSRQSPCDNGYHRCGWHVYIKLEDACKRWEMFNGKENKIVILECKLEHIKCKGKDATFRSGPDLDAKKEPEVLVGNKITFLREVSLES